MSGNSRADELRRQRRAWIRDHHPDHGGDPEVFAAGLARFAGDLADNLADTGAVGASNGTRTGSGHERLTVYRSRNPLRRLRRLVRTMLLPAGHPARSRRLR